MQKAYKKYFKMAIAANYPARKDQLLAETDRYFNALAMDYAFAKKSRNPVDKRLEFCAYFLALIKSLDAMGEDFAAIRRVCLEVVLEYVRPKNKFQVFMKRIPPMLINTWPGKIIISRFKKRAGENSNPDGFVVRILTDKQETLGFGYGFDILECGICKLFEKHGKSEFASILCEVDEITSAMAGLKLVRTGTIANGAKKCDFRFIKKN